MNRFRMRCLLFSLLLFCGCASDYKTLRLIPADQLCVSKLRPAGIQTSWFDASIDVIGKHISGLLLVKEMPDSSSRIVFTNEAGVKFFDFEFTEPGDFKVHHVIRQLDKKPVIRLLQNDFSLLLGIPFRTSSWQSWETANEIFYGVKQKSETAYFITGKDCASLQRVELGSKRKRKVSMRFFGNDQRQPDSIQLQHHTFAMEIILKKITRQ
jgi:hypothetical protein